MKVQAASIERGRGAMKRLPSAKAPDFGHFIYTRVKIVGKKEPVKVVAKAKEPGKRSSSGLWGM